MTVPTIPPGQRGFNYPPTRHKLPVFLLAALGAISCGPVIGGGYQHLELWLGGAVALVILVLVPALVQRPRAALVLALLAGAVCLVSLLVHLLTASPIKTVPVAALAGAGLLALALTPLLARRA